MAEWDTRIALILRPDEGGLSSHDSAVMGRSSNVHLEFSETLLRITGDGWDAMYLRDRVISLGVHIDG
jgi:hypothetical protein